MSHFNMWRNILLKPRPATYQKVFNQSQIHHAKIVVTRLMRTKTLLRNTQKNVVNLLCNADLVWRGRCVNLDIILNKKLWVNLQWGWLWWIFSLNCCQYQQCTGQDHFWHDFTTTTYYFFLIIYFYWLKIYKKYFKRSKDQG